MGVVRPGRAIVPLPTRIEPLREVRTTLLSASLLSIRERGYDAKYFELLEPEYLDAMKSIVPGAWAPAALGMAHYSACDRLGLSTDEQYDIGHEVGARIHQGFVGTLVRLANQSGATPWTLFSSIERLWNRMLHGSAIGVFETGPKDARLELHMCPLARFDYCRHGWRGMVAGILEPVTRRVYVTDLRGEGSNDRFVAQISWA
jgi:hypothetical protein